MRKPLMERFWEKVDIREDGCWVWTASTFGGKPGNEYGGIRLGPKAAGMRLAHRVSYEFYKGPIPDGLHIDHLCRVRLCVNPDHLEAVTPKQNVLRGVSMVAANVRKTHCPYGHPYDLFNTYVYRGSRFCRPCLRVKARRLAPGAYARWKERTGYTPRLRRFSLQEDATILALRSEGLTWVAIGERLNRQQGTIASRWYVLQSKQRGTAAA